MRTPRYSGNGVGRVVNIAAFLWRVAASETPVLRYQTSELVEKLVGLKLKDMTGDRITGLTARWV